MQKKQKEQKELIYESRILGSVPVTIVVGRYANNGCLYVGLNKRPDETGDTSFGSVTVNLRMLPPANCAFVDTNNLSGVLPFLKKYKLAHPLPLEMGSNFCSYPLFQFNMEKLWEYAPEDMASYVAGAHHWESEVTNHE